MATILLPTLLRPDAGRAAPAPGGGPRPRSRPRASVAEPLAAALEGLSPLPAEEVPLAECAGRVAAAPVVSEVDIPLFPRATMDGYALRAADTFGASPYNPVILAV